MNSRDLGASVVMSVLGLSLSNGRAAMRIAVACALVGLIAQCAVQPTAFRVTSALDSPKGLVIGGVMASDEKNLYFDMVLPGVPVRKSVLPIELAGPVAGFRRTLGFRIVALDENDLPWTAP